ncbi:MAG: TIGR03936 family radical SAM-associated protein [Aminobacteriaceae bacterium]
MPRLRLTYAKRGRACFIPHIAIPGVFTRSGRRAGIDFELSEGFSPRPRISLGPELPVGVAALREPFEVRVSTFSPDLIRAWDAALPPDFFFTGCRCVPEMVEGEARSLSKLCEASSYLVGLRGGQDSGLSKALGEMVEEGTLLHFEGARRALYYCIVESPSVRGPGLLVKELKKRGIIEGWPEVFILREAVGRLLRGEAGDPPRVLPLVPDHPDGTSTALIADES